MPGHKGKSFYVENGYGEFLDEIMNCDITEIPGADNLFQAEEVIRVTMDKYKNLYESKESYLLINGSSAGILAAILSSVSKGGKLVMARNCHKSAFNALSLGDITPVYAFPGAAPSAQKPSGTWKDASCGQKKPVPCHKETVRRSRS